MYDPIMSQTRRPHNGTDSSWTVRQVVPRTSWRVGSETCPACGGTVDLNGHHHQVELGRGRQPEAGAKLTYERRLLSFCDEPCATEWLDAASDD